MGSEMCIRDGRSAGIAGGEVTGVEMREVFARGSGQGDRASAAVGAGAAVSGVSGCFAGGWGARSRIADLARGAMMRKYAPTLWTRWQL